MSRRRTLWEEGRYPGRLVTRVAALVAVAVVVLDVLLTDDITWFFDVAFVVICVASALAVRPRDFFSVGVFPPLLMAVTVAVLAVLARGWVADPSDGLVQALVSGLAHHAGALVVGYGLTLAVLALRQVAARNAGSIRAGHQPGRRTAGRPSSHPAS